MDTEQLLKERGKTHGEYSEHARCTQALMRALMAERNWDTLPDIIKETLHMTCHKLGRIVTGNPFVDDHYRDICGYNQLVVDRIVDKVGLKSEYDLNSAAEKRTPLVIKPFHDKTDVQVYEAINHRSKEHGPGTPEDGGHHARQADPPESDTSPHSLLSQRS